MLRQSVDNEAEEECEDGEDDQSDDILLELLPDDKDEGLHRVDEPSEASGGTTREKTGDSLHLLTPGVYNSPDRNFEIYYLNLTNPDCWCLIKTLDKLLSVFLHRTTIVD